MTQPRSELTSAEDTGRTPAAGRFGQLEAQLHQAMKDARLQIRNFKKRLTACDTVADVMLQFPRNTRARLRSKGVKLTDVVNDRDRALQCYAECEAADCGRDLIPEITRTYISAIETKLLDAGTFLTALRLSRTLRQAAKGSSCDDEVLHDFWNNSVIPLLREKFPSRFPRLPDEKWIACRDLMSACILLAQIIGQSVESSPSSTSCIQVLHAEIVPRKAHPGPQGRADGSKSSALGNELKPLPPSAEKAYRMYEAAAENDHRGAKLTDRLIFDWLVKHSKVDGEAIPWTFNSFTALLRKARAHYSNSKYASRQDRTGRNVRNAEEI